jgi:hypothetical protein
MSSWFWPALAAFIVIDLVITFFVLRRVLTRAERPGGLDFVQLRPLSDAIHERVGEHLRVNYSGQPDQLPAVLAALMPELREIARQRGLTADDDTLKAALLVAVSAHGLANPRQLRDALAKVA